MKLWSEFIQLPLLFDAQRLASEALQFTENEWDYHPQSYNGNTALILVSANGERNNDYTGHMQPTDVLDKCPYIKQVLASFNTVIGRSRLMRLDPGAQVPAHSDTDYSWQHRVRIHIPIITDPNVIFSSIGHMDIHMKAGEAWIFDNWKGHSVQNNSEIQRIHLVVDTIGTADFWTMVKRGWNPSEPIGEWRQSLTTNLYRHDQNPEIRCERFNTFPVRPPDEIDNMISRFLQEIDTLQVDSVEKFNTIRNLTNRFCQDWRSHWILYWDTEEGIPHYRLLISELKSKIKKPLAEVQLYSNASNAFHVLTKWLDAAINNTVLRQLKGSSEKKQKYIGTSLFETPVFIVSAPRSGSTMLFEALKENMELWTIGDESHVEIESIRQLHPSYHRFDSGELDESDVVPQVAATLIDTFIRKLKNAQGTLFSQVTANSQTPTIRFLEKTPKNSLRIPFFRKLFPSAKFIFLYRDARQNIGSIIDAWHSGRFITYPKLPGWSGLPWSLLLPRGWRNLKGESLANIAAWQWAATNKKIIHDLLALPKDSWCLVRYEDLLNNRDESLRILCQFADVPYGPRMKAIAQKGLPYSRYTLSPPDPEKWRRYEAEISEASHIFLDTEKKLLELSHI